MTGEEFAALLDKRDELRNRCDRGRSSHVVVPRDTYAELIDVEVEIAAEMARELSADEFRDESPDCRCETCPRGGPFTCIGGEND